MANSGQPIRLVVVLREIADVLERGQQSPTLARESRLQAILQAAASEACSARGWDAGTWWLDGQDRRAVTVRRIAAREALAAGYNRSEVARALGRHPSTVSGARR